MTTVPVLAKNVQRDCMIILNWWKKTKDKWATDCERYLKKVTALMKRRKYPWWHFIFGGKKPLTPLNYALMSPEWAKWMRCKYVRAMYYLPEDDKIMMNDINRLLSAAERALGENTKLTNPVMNLSSEDAHFLSDYVKKAKEKK